MGESNGKETTTERLDRLEASHVRLMTEHEVYAAAHDKFMADHDKFVADQHAAWKRRDLEFERDQKAWKEADAALGRRIDALVSGFGEFMRQGKE